MAPGPTNVVCGVLDDKYFPDHFEQTDQTTDFGYIGLW